MTEIIEPDARMSDDDIRLCLGLTEDELSKMRDLASQVRTMLYAHMTTFKGLGECNVFKRYYDTWNSMDDIERFIIIGNYGMRPKDLCLGIEMYIDTMEGCRWRD